MTSIIGELAGLKKAKRIYFVFLYLLVFFILFYPIPLFTYTFSGIEGVLKFPIGLLLFILAWDLQRNNV